MHRKGPARPARYFAGKPVAGAGAGMSSDVSSDSGSDSEIHSDSERVDGSSKLAVNLRNIKVEDQQNNEEEDIKTDIKTKIKEEMQESDQEINQDQDQDQEADQEKPNDTADVNKHRSSPEKSAESSTSTSSESSSDAESESGSDSDSEQETLVKPSFVPKSMRRSGPKSTPPNSNPNPNVSTSRKEQTLKMVEQTIRDEKLASLTSKHKNTSLGDNEVLQIDDTDNLDPEAEYEAWKSRERFRMKRERKEIEQQELERERQEELRAMTEDQRAELHAQRLQQQQQKDLGTTNKSPINPVKDPNVKDKQKYYHKGAFYQDEELLRKRDFSEAVEDGAKNMSAVPKYLRNLHKIDPDDPQTTGKHEDNDLEEYGIEYGQARATKTRRI